MTPGIITHLEHLKSWFFNLDKPLVRVFATHQKVTPKSTTLMQFPSPDDMYDERDMEKSWQMLQSHLSMISDGQYTIYVYDEFTKKEVSGIKYIKGNINQSTSYSNAYGLPLGAYSDVASKNMAINGLPSFVGALPGYISQEQATLMTNNALMQKQIEDLKQIATGPGVETLFDKAVALCETLGVKEAIQQFIQLKVATAINNPIVSGTPQSKKTVGPIDQDTLTNDNSSEDTLTDEDYGQIDHAVESISKKLNQNPVVLMNNLSAFLEKNPDKIELLKQIIHS